MDAFAADTATWIDDSGRDLSQRIWGNRIGLRAHIERMIGDAIAQGLTVDDVATHLIRYVSPDYARSGEGKARYAANRLASNEMRRGNAIATQQVALTNPTGGFLRYTVAAGHIDPDECVPAGTLVTTPEGTMPIESLNAGDFVITHRGRARRVVKTFRRSLDHQPIVTLRARGVRSPDQVVTMTPNHPVLTDRGWIAAGDLQTGCRCYAEASLPAASCCQPSSDGHRRETPDSRESDTIEDRRTVVAARCGEAAYQDCRRPRNVYPGVHEPSRGHDVPYGDNAVCCVPSSWGSHLLDALQNVAVAFRRAWSKCLDGVCQSWGSPPLLAGSMHWSSTFAPGTPRTISRRLGTSLDHWRVAPDSTHSSSTSDQLRFGALGTPSGTLDTFSQPACPDCATAVRTSCCRSDAPRIATRGVRRIVELVGSRNARKSAREREFSYVNCNMDVRDMVELTVTSIAWNYGFSGEVFNLHVAEDESYIANGIVVHNCTDIANRITQYGRGVYPARECPLPPRHVGCRCEATEVGVDARDMDAFVDKLRVEYGLNDPPDLSPDELSVFRRETAQIRQDVVVMFRGWFEQTGLVSRESLMESSPTVRQWVDSLQREKRRRR